MTVVHAALYTSPSIRSLNEEERKVHYIANALKAAEWRAVSEAAWMLSDYVEANDILIPIPNSAGDTLANRCLAYTLSRRTGANVCDVLRRAHAVHSSHLLRRNGSPGLKASDHKFILTGEFTRKSGGRVFFLDNVYTTGATMSAAVELVPDAIALVFARSHEEVVHRCEAQKAS